MHGTQRLSGPLADGAGLKAPNAVLQADEMNGQEYKKEELTDMCKPEVCRLCYKSWSEDVSVCVRIQVRGYVSVRVCEWVCECVGV